VRPLARKYLLQQRPKQPFLHLMMTRYDVNGTPFCALSKEAQGTEMHSEQAGAIIETCCACSGLGASLQCKRQYLETQLQEVGFRVLPAQGTYFLVADIR